MKRLNSLIIGLLACLLLFAVACGGDDNFTPEPTSGVTSEPTSRPTSEPTSQPTSRPTQIVSPETGLFIEVDGDALKFSNLTSDVPNAAQTLQGSFRVGNGTQVVLDFQNVSTINQHNWVLVKNGTKDAVAARGIEAGAINDWLQPGDSDVIANTKLLVTGGKAVIRFAAPPPGQYQFVCTFPGHNGTMFGDFEVTP